MAAPAQDDSTAGLPVDFRDLFGRSSTSDDYGVPPPRTALPPRPDGRPRLRSVAPFAPKPAFGLVEQQLHFTWTEAMTADVVSLLERRAQRYLDIGVLDFFRDLPEAARAARGLERAGVRVLGQFVQLRETDLALLKCMTPSAIGAMRDNLSVIGLRFEMHLPSWNRAMRMAAAL